VKTRDATKLFLPRGDKKKGKIVKAICTSKCIFSEPRDVKFVLETLGKNEFEPYILHALADIEKEKLARLKKVNDSYLLR
jgi:hypothetical protein